MQQVDLQLEGRTVMVLGPGDYLDRAIVRAVASEGAASLATTDGVNHHDLAQHGDGAPQWTSIEPHIDAFVASRLRYFLEEQGRTPDAVVLHVDVLETLNARGRPRWWRFGRDFDAVLRTTAEAVVAAIPRLGKCQVVLLYRLADDRERDSAMRWLDRAMLAVLERSRSDGADIRVNGLLVGTDDLHAEAADLVALLCSPIAAGISGALIPMDNGSLAGEYLNHRHESRSR